MRIYTPVAKVGAVIVASLATVLVAVPLTAVRVELGFAWVVVAVLSVVIWAARTFRGPGESDAARPWWRMTSTRGGGLLLSAAFFTQTATALFQVPTSPYPVLAVIGGSVALVVGALYLHSAIRVRPEPATA